jgi:prepilin-type N-terminal cleavage/methylation domain-containing protein
MKTEFKAKFLQHINKRRQDEGFTLIELLVVIIIIGILSAIALPSFLSQANKAKQSEAKQYASSIVKAQQAYYAENSKFSEQMTALGIGLKTSTQNYTYILTLTGNTGAQAAANPAPDGALKSYNGTVGLVPSGDAKGTQSVLCEHLSAGQAAVAGVADGNTVSCGANMTEVTK